MGQICRKCGETIDYKQIRSLDMVINNMNTKKAEIREKQRNQETVYRTEAKNEEQVQTKAYKHLAPDDDIRNNETVFSQPFFENKTIDTDKMSGREFEVFLSNIFIELKCDVQLTPESNDQGADLIITDIFDKRIAVQAKRYTGNVGNGAIQELLGGMLFYNCEEGIVVTTSDFTDQAYSLAAKNSKIHLWNGVKLQALLRKVNWVT